jgi:hypothetical protein
MLYYYTMRGESFYPKSQTSFNLNVSSHCFLYSCSSPTPNLNVGEEPRMFFRSPLSSWDSIKFDGGKLECHGKQLL